MAPVRGGRDGVRRVGRGGQDVENLVDALECGEALLNLDHAVGQPLHRAVDVAEVEQEGHQGALGEGGPVPVAGEHQPGADHHHRRLGEELQGVGVAVEGTLDAGVVVLQVLDPGAGLLEGLARVLLAGEGLHHPASVAGQRFAQRLQQAG